MACRLPALQADNPSCVLLPELAGDEALRTGQLPASARDYRVQVSDVHACCTTLPKRVALLLAERPGPLLLVGCSMGGMLLDGLQRLPASG